MLFVVDFFVCYLFIMMRMEDGVVLKACYTKHSSSHLSLCSVIRDLFRMIIMMSSSKFQFVNSSFVSICID